MYVGRGACTVVLQQACVDAHKLSLGGPRMTLQVILQVLQLRGEDRVAQDFAKDMTLNMSHARKWAGK